MLMLMRMIIGIIIGSICSLATLVHAGDTSGNAGVYQQPEHYVAEVFERPPSVEALWPSPELRQQLKQVLGHAPSLRFRYWGANGKTVWILDEIGKDRPITAGFVVNQGRLEDVRVLVFRESRGWEIKHGFFTRQFADLWLSTGDRLSGPIDNITGATLSVKAMTRMATAALLLHEHSSQNAATLANAR